MLSFKEGGRKIARVKGGKDDGKIIYLKEDNNNEELDIKDLSKDFFNK